MYGDSDWNGRRFVIVDTGGLEVDPADQIELKVQEQARLAISEADVILFLVDAVTGLTPADEEAAEAAPRSTKPIIVAGQQDRQHPARGRTPPSSTRSAGRRLTRSPRRTGRGTGDLLDAIVWALPPETEQEISRKAKGEGGRRVGQGGLGRPARALRRR
jgi:GTP-binding protein